MTTQTLNLNCVVFPIMLGHVLIEDAVKSNMATTAVAWHDPGCAKVVGNVSLRARSSLFDVFRSTGELKTIAYVFETLTRPNVAALAAEMFHHVSS